MSKTEGIFKPLEMKLPNFICVDKHISQEESPQFSLYFQLSVTQKTLKENLPSFGIYNRKFMDLDKLQFSTAYGSVIKQNLIYILVFY